MHSSSTVPTDVVKAIHLLLVVTNKNETFTCKFMQEVVSGLGDVRCSTNADPILSEDFLCFLFIDPRGRKVLATQRPGPLR